MPGDVVLEFGDRPVKTAGDVHAAVASTPIGATVEVDVLTADGEVTRSVVVSARTTHRVGAPSLDEHRPRR